MAVTLIINPGSSSKKYFLVTDGRVIASFRFERNEQQFEMCREENGLQKICEGISSEQYGTALRQVLDSALRSGTITNLSDITRVGVRIVAPGTYFQAHRVIDEAYLVILRGQEGSAPLHIPPTVREIDQLRLELPEALIVGVSDSAFHTTLPTHARTFAILAGDSSLFDLYRFGYHGLSCTSVVRRLPAWLPATARRVIVCHLGSGMSMTALLDGVSIDTTMGFGPGSGLMMGARTGDIEPGLLLELMRVKNLGLFDAQTYLQTQGGFVGLAGESDFRHLLERYAQGDEMVKAAFLQCAYQFQKTVGSFTMALGGLDAIVLTATAAERSSALRTILLEGLEWLGVTLDQERNEEVVSQDGFITTATATVPVLVLRTDELGELLATTLSFQSQHN